MNYVNSLSLSIFMNITYKYVLVFVDHLIKMRHLIFITSIVVFESLVQFSSFSEFDEKNSQISLKFDANKANI